MPHLSANDRNTVTCQLKWNPQHRQSARTLAALPWCTASNCHLLGCWQLHNAARITRSTAQLATAMLRCKVVLQNRRCRCASSHATVPYKTTSTTCAAATAAHAEPCSACQLQVHTQSMAVLHMTPEAPILANTAQRSCATRHTKNGQAPPATSCTQCHTPGA